MNARAIRKPPHLAHIAQRTQTRTMNGEMKPILRRRSKGSKSRREPHVLIRIHEIMTGDAATATSRLVMAETSSLPEVPMSCDDRPPEFRLLIFHPSGLKKSQFSHPLPESRTNSKLFPHKRKAKSDNGRCEKARRCRTFLARRKKEMSGRCTRRQGQSKEQRTYSSL
jgi:hypothetical protein